MGTQEDLHLVMGSIVSWKGDNTAHNQMDAVNSNTIEHYFKLLMETLVKNKLLNAPHQIYNVDEKWFTTGSEGFECSGGAFM